MKQKLNLKKGTAVGLCMAGLFVLIGASDCDGNNPGADSDSPQSYASTDIPLDHNVYTISGTVTAAVSSLTRETKPATGSEFGIVSGGSGFITGNYSGPVQSGKSFIRFQVASASPATSLAPVGGVIVIKATDTKATALATGDSVTFKCRRQYEAVAAVEDNQDLNVEKDATWELDYCRLATPVLQK